MSGFSAAAGWNRCRETICWLFNHPLRWRQRRARRLQGRGASLRPPCSPPCLCASVANMTGASVQVGTCCPVRPEHRSLASQARTRPARSPVSAPSLQRRHAVHDDVLDAFGQLVRPRVGRPCRARAAGIEHHHVRARARARARRGRASRNCSAGSEVILRIGLRQRNGPAVQRSAQESGERAVGARVRVILRSAARPARAPRRRSRS